jgi:hypothetical protein
MVLKIMELLKLCKIFCNTLDYREGSNYVYIITSIIAFYLEDLMIFFENMRVTLMKISS